MSAATCVIPRGWSIGRACVALCARAKASGVEQRAGFNWVELVAQPWADAESLAGAYWRAVADRRVSTEIPELSCPDLAAAAMVDDYANFVREGLAAERRAA